jgi:hypothetical protein
MLKSLPLGFFSTGTLANPLLTSPTMIYAGSNMPIPAQDDPRLVFSTLFAGSTASGPALAAAQKQRKSVLDLVRADFTDLRAGLSAADKSRLDQHAEFLRSVETDVTSMGCNNLNPNDYNFGTLQQTDGPRILKAQLDLMALALACNRTRVASMQFSYGLAPMIYSWLESRQPGVSQSNLHGFTHVNPATGKRGDKWFLEIEKWYVEQVAYFVAQLKALNVFDGTVILWTTTESRTYHERPPVSDEEARVDLMYVLIGSGGGYYKTGYVVDDYFQRYGTTQQLGGACYGTNAPGDRKGLFLNVAKAFGFQGTSPFGVNTPFPGLTVNNG